MTREEVKEWLPILTAFTDGKAVQFKGVGSDENWTESKTVDFCYSPSYYRIKPSPVYRPFKDGKELVAEYCKRFGVERKAWEMPSIWVKPIAVGISYLITTIFDDAVVVVAFSCGDRMKSDGGKPIAIPFYMFKSVFTFLDGSPCGVKEEASDVTSD